MIIANFIFHSPIGQLSIAADDTHLLAILFVSKNNDAEKMQQNNCNHPIIKECCSQLIEYFNGERKIFDLPINQSGTAFQQQVWLTLSNIAYGKTISYLTLSKRINNIKAIRAVGTANGKNKISIVVPCHRVIGTDGSLTGYAGELWRKKWLLEHEAKNANGLQTLF